MFWPSQKQHNGQRRGASCNCCNRCINFSNSNRTPILENKCCNFFIKLSAVVVLGLFGSSLSAVFWLSLFGLASTEALELVFSMKHILVQQKGAFFVTGNALFYLIWVVLFLAYTKEQTGKVQIYILLCTFSYACTIVKHIENIKILRDNGEIDTIRETSKSKAAFKFYF